jgi:hypothetical protein
MSKPKNCSSIEKCHNLNIKMYKFQEILDLFELTNKISEDDIKRCKKTVLMTHPDKSRLPPEYFLFYKKAFDVILEFYKNQTKTTQEVTKENAQYTHFNPNSWDKNTNKKIGENINKMEHGEFNNKFNQLFDDNMGVYTKPNAEKNNWFKSTESQYEMPQEKNINRAFEQIKGQSNGLTMYRGIQNMNSSAGVSVGKLYDQEEDEQNQEYVCSDPFSKLKYDDLRKVHKDQTIFAVGEKDYDSVRKYANVEQFSRERATQDMTPIDKTSAEKMLKNQEQQMVEQMMKNEYNAKLRSMEYAEKNRGILASFMHISNS